MFLRAVLAFLALPTLAGMVAPVLIARSDPWRGQTQPWGLSVAGVGAAVLLWCVRDFYAFGKGTLAPWAPPKRLVVVGLYRMVRNPMYLGVVTLVGGLAWWQSSPVVALYALFLLAAFHLRVLVHEEPHLARAFPEAWRIYSAAVRRWLPRLRPWAVPPELTAARPLEP